jgi:hypothetical protein
MSVRHIVAVPQKPGSAEAPVAFCGAVAPVSPGCTTKAPICQLCKAERRRFHQWLAQVARGFRCPECGGPIVRASGCQFCRECGWERC